MSSHSSRFSRRDLLKAAAAGAGAGFLPRIAGAEIVSEYPSNKWGTPGLYPARVIAVHHPKCTNGDYEFQTAPIQKMIRAGLTALTGESDYAAAWRQFAGPGDVVGIKVNPNGNERTQSSPAAVMEIVHGLTLAGVAQKDIIVYERYAEILGWISSWFPSSLQTASASPAYSDDQTAIAGYDPNHYVDLPLLLSWQTPSNPAHRRSFAAEFITKRVNKVINLAVLKNHNAAGVTGALKNLSHGFTNNVNRSHPATERHYTTYIPAVISMPVIRYKAVLHIIDGVHGQYEGGPHGPIDYTWQHKTMYFATDAVALDRTAWKALDAQRVKMKMPVLASSPPSVGKDGPLQQPQYIASAGEAGLGEWRDEKIDLRLTNLK